MSPPILKSRSNLAVSFSNKLELTTAAAAPGDLVVVWYEGVAWYGGNVGGPILPAGFKVLYEYADASSYKGLAWMKVPSVGYSKLTLVAGADQLTTGGWWGQSAVFGNVAYRAPGWLEVPGTAGSYATTTRADMGAITSKFGVLARVEFDQLGVAQWFHGWANGDMGFGLDASNRPIIYLNNTLGNPIGGVAANAPIPGLTTNRPIWLRADINVVTGTIDYFYSYDDLDRWDGVLTHLTTLGTAVAGLNGGTTPRVSNSDTVFYGARDAATTPFNGKVFASYEFVPFFITLSRNFSDAMPAGTALVGTAYNPRPTDEDFANAPFDQYDVCFGGFCFFTNDDVRIPGQYVAGPDRLAYHVFRGSKFGAPQVNDPISGPVDWDAYGDLAANALGLYMKLVTRTKEVSATFTDADVANDGSYGYGYHTLIIRGKTDPVVLPVLPQPPRLELGCAESYRAFVTEMDYDTVIDEILWSDLSWSRVLDDISDAGGTFPDQLGGVNCLAKHGGLKAWKHGLRIERNDGLVWNGPITNVRRTGDTIVVQAHDVLARMRRRLAIRDALVTYVQADAGSIFYDLLAIHSRLSSDAWALDVPLVATGVPVDRVLKPKEMKYAWDLAAELLGTAVDAFVANGRLFVFEPGTGWTYQADIRRTLPGSYNINHDLIYGMFTEDAWNTRPNWSLDGVGQGNYFVVPVADSGEYGFRTFSVAEVAAAQLEFGVLDYVDPDPLEVPADQPPTAVAASLSARAQSLAALRAYAPSTLEGGSLSPKAPIDIDNLLPGSIWLMDVFDAGYGQLLTASRLRRIEVSVKKNDDGTVLETISPTLEPPGTLGGPDV